MRNAVLAAVLAVGTLLVEAGQPRWRELPAEVLFELNCGEFELGPPPACRLRGGPLKGVEDRWDKRVKIPAASPAATPAKPGRLTLEAERGAQLCIGSADWERYAVSAEVMLGSGRLLSLAAATEEGKEVRPGYRLELRAAEADPLKINTSASSRDGDLLTRTAGARRVKRWAPLRMRPDLGGLAYSYSKEASEAALRRLQREFGATVGWPERWFRLRIEITPRQARLWADGLLVASVEAPKWTRGGVCLSLNAGDRVRLLRVEKLPAATDGFLPLDLTARFNAQAAATSSLPRPGGLIQVDGVPFYWTSTQGKPNHLDVGKVEFRGRSAYIRCDAAGNDPKRTMLRVPRRQYNQLALLAAADAAATTTPVLNVRMVKPWRGMLVDHCAPVPRTNATDAGAPALPLAPGQKLWLVRVPLDPGAFQDFLASEAETALELDLTRPPRRAGYPEVVAQRSGVRIFAATLLESPVEMTVGSDEFGHIFVQPEVPAFTFRLRNTTPRAQPVAIEGRVTDFYGREKLHKASLELAPAESRAHALSLPAEVLGLHYLDARLLDAQGQTLGRRQTTFALLPPDTRQADRDSPFGMWVFMGGHFGAGAEAAGSLMSKIGVRWSHVSKTLWDDGFSKRHRVYPAYAPLLRNVQSAEDALAKIRENPHQQLWTVFAETALSGRHYNYFPPELLENPAPMKLTPEEEEKFQACWKLAVECSQAARKHHPDLELSFGNGYPQFIATFLSRKYPRNLFDFLGLDFLGDRMYMFYYLREVAKHYGCGDVPFDITEGFYVCSGCGAYPDRAREREQSDVYIRGFLRGLALGVQRFSAACEIWDPGSDYHFTGYGSVGLCHMGPELNPKPGYCAFGTMTLLLDRAKFHSMVSVGSANAHLLRFDGPRGPVYAAWTARGRRRLAFKAATGARPRLTDSQGNSRALPVGKGEAALEIDPTPVWIQDAGVIDKARLGPAVYDTAPSPTARLLVRAGDPGAWSLDPAACPELEALERDTPVTRAAFALAPAEGREPGRKALAITLKDEPGVSPHRLRYAVLRPAKHLAIPKGAARLGLWLRGNGAAWVDLELVDAKGERWTSVRRPRGYSFGMPYAGFHAFDGWSYIPWPFPGTAPGEPWATWRHTRGDGVLDFPVRLSALILEQYARVVYINHLAPADSPTWRIGDILWEPSPE